MSQHRHLAAILFADIAGYTAMMQKDEKMAMSTVRHFQENLEKCVVKHDGEVFQYYGDGCLCFFQSAGTALFCAMELQRHFQMEPVVPLRIGIHIGEILIEGEKVFGDGVNLASRIESLGQPGAVLFSRNVNEKIRNRTEFQSVSLGSFEFKNVERPVEVFALANEGLLIPDRASMSGKLKNKKKPKGLLSSRSFILGVTMILLAVVLLKWAPDLSKMFTGKSVMANEAIAQSIAVLPFEYLHGEDVNYLADGIADEIRSQLLTLNNLQVISRSSSNFYRGKHMTSNQIGRELGVGYLLEGNVQSMQGMAKIVVTLVNTSNSEIERNMPFLIKELNDVFSLQSDIAKNIVSTLELELSPKETEQLEKVPTQNPEAYRKFRRAQNLVHRGGGRVPELDSAVTLFNEAIDLDPNFARAYSGLSDAYMHYIYWGRKPAKEMIEKANHAIVEALKLDNETGECYGTLGAIDFYNHSLASSEKNLEKAIQLSPNYLRSYVFLSRIRSYQGRIEDGLSLLEKAVSLDPKSLPILGGKANFYYTTRMFEEGLEYISEVRKEHPDASFLKWLHGYVLTGNGQFQEAIDMFLSRGNTTNWMLGYAYGMAGQEKEARAILESQLEKRESGTHVPAYMIATIYMGLSDRENAIKWLEQDYADGGQGLFFWGLKNDIKFDPIRIEPRFQALLDKIQ